jgi:hypothetical protein
MQVNSNNEGLEISRDQSFVVDSSFYSEDNEKSHMILDEIPTNSLNCSISDDNKEKNSEKDSSLSLSNQSISSLKDKEEDSKWEDDNTIEYILMDFKDNLKLSDLVINNIDNLEK